jgi:hypothetical protein
MAPIPSARQTEPGIVPWLRGGVVACMLILVFVVHEGGLQWIPISAGVLFLTLEVLLMTRPGQRTG